LSKWEAFHTKDLLKVGGEKRRIRNAKVPFAARVDSPASTPNRGEVRNSQC